MADLLMPELYENLTALCSRNIGFHSKDIQLDSIKYRIFNYHLCSYEQFHKHPSALNCRGSMFDVTDPENVKLVCLPPEKFFNYEEGNGLNIHPLGTFGVQMEKLDGSLISTYLHKEQVRLKSKASLTSSQALETMQLLTGTVRFCSPIALQNYWTIRFLSRHISSGSC
jgi:T4 RnlA family RNA ligase